MNNTRSQVRAGRPRRLFTKQPAAALQSRQERVEDVIADLGGLPSRLDFPCARCGAAQGARCEGGELHKPRAELYLAAYQQIRQRAEDIVSANRDGLEP